MQDLSKKRETLTDPVFGNFLLIFTETLPLTWICDETEKLSQLVIADSTIINDKIQVN